MYRLGAQPLPVSDFETLDHGLGIVKRQNTERHRQHTWHRHYLVALIAAGMAFWIEIGGLVLAGERITPDVMTIVTKFTAGFILLAFFLGLYMMSRDSGKSRRWSLVAVAATIVTLAAAIASVITLIG